MAQILAALKLLLEFVSLCKGLFEMYRQAHKEGWLEDGRALAKQIKEAKTDDERRALLRRLVEHSSSLPR